MSLGSGFAYNYPALLKLAFNDAMTYNPETGKGGTVMGIRFRGQKTKHWNKPHLSVLEELLWLKEKHADARFDQMSTSDYLQAHAIVGLKDAGGPDLTEYHKIGRRDAESEEDLEGALDVPQPEDGATKFRDAFLEKGFTEREMTAIAWIYIYGTYRSEYEKQYTSSPIFVNDYFKYLVDDSSEKGFALDKILLGENDTKEFVTLFAEENKEFHEAFTDAYLKLYTLGNDDQNLTLEMPEINY